MRTLCLSALLMVLLLGSLQLTSSAPAGHTPDCCPKLTTMRIPLSKVQSITRTSSACPLKAIVLKTKAGKEFCVDPDSELVKRMHQPTARTSTINSTALSRSPFIMAHKTLPLHTLLSTPLHLSGFEPATSAIMRILLSALLMVLLLGSLQLTSSAPAVHHADCCTKLTAVKKIPVRQVESITPMSSTCTVKAIVIKTKAGRKWCVDPDTEWVQGHVAILDQRHKTTANY
ncbi:uncharacterized protein [Salminus brasiliensis]|uniref:uncharacterized protein n=1 Tax=Salminus brasiliensis TaxID=930266 RepID=UPI003B833830